MRLPSYYLFSLQIKHTMSIYQRKFPLINFFTLLILYTLYSCHSFSQNKDSIQTAYKDAIRGTVITRLMELPFETRIFDSPPIPSVNINDYMKIHLKYPRDAQKLDLEGAVVVHFMVNRKGHVHGAYIEGSTNAIFNTEALRLVRNLPPFIPAKRNHKPERLEQILKMAFMLHEVLQ